MSDAPPPPPRVPAVLPPLLTAPPPPARRGWRLKAPTPLPPASPLKRFLLGLAVSLVLGAVGTFALLGMPGLLPLGIANVAIQVAGGPDRLTALRESSWGAALWVTLLWGVPFAPALALFTWRRPRALPALAWLFAFGAAFVWALGLAFWTLLLT